MKVSAQYLLLPKTIARKKPWLPAKVFGVKCTAKGLAKSGPLPLVCRGHATNMYIKGHIYSYPFVRQGRPKWSQQFRSKSILSQLAWKVTGFSLTPPITFVMPKIWIGEAEDLSVSIPGPIPSDDFRGIGRQLGGGGVLFGTGDFFRCIHG